MTSSRERYALRQAGRRSFVLSPGAWALALILKYASLVGYGATAIIALVPSFVEVGGHWFALGWASVVFAFAALALAGTIRTWRTGHYRFERWAIAALVLVFLTYSVVLVVRGVLIGDWSAIATAWLPLGFSWAPMFRFYSLGLRDE